MGQQLMPESPVPKKGTRFRSHMDSMGADTLGLVFLQRLLDPGEGGDGWLKLGKV